MIWLYLFALAGLALVWRLLRGPTAGDRMLSLNIMACMIVMYTMYRAVATANHFLMDVALVIAVLSFVGMLGIVKWLPRKEEKK